MRQVIIINQVINEICIYQWGEYETGALHESSDQWNLYLQMGQYVMWSLLTKWAIKSTLTNGVNMRQVINEISFS